MRAPCTLWDFVSLDDHEMNPLTVCAPCRWKGARKDDPLSKGEREQLQDVIVVLRGNNVPQQTLSQVSHSHSHTVLGGEGWPQNLTQCLGVLMASTLRTHGLCYFFLAPPASDA